MAHIDERLPVTILSGFQGAGKTIPESDQLKAIQLDALRNRG